MSEVSPKKQDICTEQIQEGSIISEAGQRLLASNLNFHNERNLKEHRWNLNGTYKEGEASYIDGHLVSPYNYSIASISIYNYIDGNADSTEFDLEYIDVNGVNQGSIFSTIPSVSSGNGNHYHYMLRVVDDVELVGSGTITKPVFLKTQFNAGEAIILKLNLGMVSAEDLTVVIHYLEEN